MSATPRAFRAVSYNVHKCRGLDFKVSPGRIADVLREVDPDIVALQEVFLRPAAEREANQAGYISQALGLACVSGSVRELAGGLYGNVILSRFPVRHRRTFDISVAGREERGCLRADLDLGEEVLLHVFNVHLGTGFIERRKQARMLIDVELLEHEDRGGPRLVMGDFNEWTAGLVSESLSARFQSLDIPAHLEHPRTYPGVFPVLHLDHVYHDPDLTVESVGLHRSRRSILASDHLPLVVDFQLAEAATVEGG